jgi:glycerol-3-phosphate acyltransferase PlsX
MRIAVDAMGGDNAPDEIIAGALASIELLAEDDELILVGPEEKIGGNCHLRNSGRARLA